jgi:hypothetical protein
VSRRFGANEDLLAYSRDSEPWRSPASPARSVDADVHLGHDGRPKGAIRNHRGGAMLSLVTEVELGIHREDGALLVMPMCHANSLYFFGAFSYCGGDHASTRARASIPSTGADARGGRRDLHLAGADALRDDARLPPAARGARPRPVTKLMISSAPARATPSARSWSSSAFRPVRALRLDRGRLGHDAPPARAVHPPRHGRPGVASAQHRSGCSTTTGSEVPDGQPGELYSCNPHTFDGYWKRPDKDERRSGATGARSATMALRDGEGYIRLIDRKKNMIISGGENVYPSEVEAVNLRCPKVKDAAVIGLPTTSGESGSTPWSCCTTAATADEAELLDFCRSRIAGYKRPRSVSFIRDEDMPRTATGKIQHRGAASRGSERSAREPP